MTVKVADFGLSRDVYVSDYYVTSNKNMGVPIKWYAPEAIKEGKFSEKTDVVSSIHFLVRGYKLS